MVRGDYFVDGLDCADCARRAEDGVGRIPGVRAAAGRPDQRRLTVEYDPGVTRPGDIEEALGRLGFVARPLEARARALKDGHAVWRTPFARRTYVSAGLFLLGLLTLVAAGGGPAWTAPRPLPGGLAELWFTLAALVGGWNFVPAGLRAALRRVLDMHVLMTLAILGALAIGEFLEAGAIAFLFSIAELLESYSVRRAHDALDALMELSPERATVLRDGREVVVPAAEIRPGERFLLRSGERVAVDGRVIEGRATVDASAITGESTPVERAPGDPLFSGMLSAGGYVVALAEKPLEESTLARIVSLVERSTARRSPSERFVQRFARRYTPIVASLAVLTATIPIFLLGAPAGLWVERALTLLVIACPCALVISTPVAVVSGLTAGARNGVLIKGGEVLERLAEVRAVALDKTGTLTHGHLEVTDVVTLAELPAAQLLARAAAVEHRSEHPIARAIVRRAARDGERPLARRVTDFEPLAGVGARAKVDGVTVTVTAPSAIPGGLSNERAETLSSQGKTVVVVSLDGRPAGLIALADRPRPEARGAIAALRELGIRRVLILTGDDPRVAAAIGREVGVGEWEAGLRPEEKSRRVEALREGVVTAMVGDGVNDAPSLAAADVGIAMGAAGSDVALETADAALMADELDRLPYLFRLGRAGRRVIRQNVAASIVVKLALAAAVPFGLVSLVAAVLIGDMGASLAVIANSLRLARLRP